MAAVTCPQCGTQNTTDDKFCGTCGTALKKGADAKRAADNSRKAAPNRNILFLVAGVVFLGVALALVWGLLSSGTRPAAVAVVPTPTASNLPFPKVKRMEPSAAKAQLDAAGAVFVDVRGQSDYAAGHIPGAVLIPLEEFEKRYSELPRDRTVVTYCTWPAEQSSAGAAQFMMDNGYTQVYAIRGGLDAWAQAGYPIEK